VVALVLAVEVVGPVFVEVAVGVQGAEFEDGFGGLDAPAGAGDGHPVFDQVAAGAFDDASGDGPPGGQGPGVVQTGDVGLQVGRGPGRGLASGGAELAGGGGLAQGGGDLPGAAVQDGREAVPDPGARLGAGFGVEAPGRGSAAVMARVPVRRVAMVRLWATTGASALRSLSCRAS